MPIVWIRNAVLCESSMPASGASPPNAFHLARRYASPTARQGASHTAPRRTQLAALSPGTRPKHRKQTASTAGTNAPTSFEKAAAPYARAESTTQIARALTERAVPPRGIAAAKARIERSAKAAARSSLRPVTLSTASQWTGWAANRAAAANAKPAEESCQRARANTSHTTTT